MTAGHKCMGVVGVVRRRKCLPFVRMSRCPKGFPSCCGKRTYCATGSSHNDPPWPFSRLSSCSPQVAKQMSKFELYSFPSMCLGMTRATVLEPAWYQQQQTSVQDTKLWCSSCSPDMPQLLHRSHTFLAPADQTRHVLRSPARLLTALSPFGRLLRLLCTFTTSRPVPDPAETRCNSGSQASSGPPGRSLYQFSHGTD